MAVRRSKGGGAARASIAQSLRQLLLFAGTMGAIIAQSCGPTLRSVHNHRAAASAARPWCFHMAPAESADKKAVRSEAFAAVNASAAQG